MFVWEGGNGSRSRIRVVFRDRGRGREYGRWVAKEGRGYSIGSRVGWPPPGATVSEGSRDGQHTLSTHTHEHGASVVMVVVGGGAVVVGVIVVDVIAVAVGGGAVMVVAIVVVAGGGLGE